MAIDRHCQCQCHGEGTNLGGGVVAPDGNIRHLVKEHSGLHEGTRESQNMYHLSGSGSSISAHAVALYAVRSN